MEEIIFFCKKNNLVLIASEILQNCIFPDVVNGKLVPQAQSLNCSIKDSTGNKVENKPKNFYSFRYVINKLKSDLELISFNSISRTPFYL